MTDITNKSKHELTNIVFTDGELYMDRHKSWFLEVITERFECTEEQIDILKNDLDNDSINEY
jgi:hypothetical protein